MRCYEANSFFLNHMYNEDTWVGPVKAWTLLMMQKGDSSRRIILFFSSFSKSLLSTCWWPHLNSNTSSIRLLHSPQLKARKEIRASRPSSRNALEFHYNGLVFCAWVAQHHNHLSYFSSITIKKYHTIIWYKWIEVQLNTIHSSEWLRTLHTENMNYQRKVLKFLIASQKFSTVCILVTSTFRPLAKWIWKHMLNMPVKEHPLEMQIELCLCMFLCLVLVAAHFTCVHLKQTMPKWPFSWS